MSNENGLRTIAVEPYYVPQGEEREVFAACHARGLPVMLKGPTGCGKTRFVEHMAWRLGKPLVTIACHDDLSASDLTGRWLIRGAETVWVDGPLIFGPSGHVILRHADQLPLALSQAVRDLVGG
jgi:MoxR-like ATPase